MIKKIFILVDDISVKLNIYIFNNFKILLTFGGVLEFWNLLWISDGSFLQVKVLSIANSRIVLLLLKRLSKETNFEL